ncbi:MAG: hypothetical protein IH988_01730 [Planctomycetes bacterium]|nr:hypothetical protein [Planctomycetota bacterium]
MKRTVHIGLVFMLGAGIGMVFYPAITRGKGPPSKAYEVSITRDAMRETFLIVLRNNTRSTFAGTIRYDIVEMKDGKPHVIKSYAPFSVNVASQRNSDSRKRINFELAARVEAKDSKGNIVARNSTRM